MSEFWVLIPAAGSGSRMGSSIKKQFLPMRDGRELLFHTLDIFQERESIEGIVLAVSPEDISFCQRRAFELGFSKVKHVVPGSATRQQSVLQGLLALPSSCTHVLIHDAVRPHLDAASLSRVMQEAEQYGAAVLAVPVKDTIKVADEQGFVRTTPDRATLWSIQTPQGFRKNLILTAHQAAAQAQDVSCTDDAQVVERYTDHPVRLTLGSYANLKITTPEDLALLESWKS